MWVSSFVFPVKVSILSLTTHEYTLVAEMVRWSPLASLPSISYHSACLLLSFFQAFLSIYICLSEWCASTEDGGSSKGWRSCENEEEPPVRDFWEFSSVPPDDGDFTGVHRGRLKQSVSGFSASRFSFLKLIPRDFAQGQDSPPSVWWTKSC